MAVAHKKGAASGAPTCKQNAVVPGDLPEGWMWKTLGEIAEVVGGGTPRTSVPANFEGGSIPWVTPADLSGYINQSDVGSAAIPLPPADEQAVIVSEVERCLSVATEIEGAIATNFKRAERLRQAILKKAFSGDLLMD